MLQGKKIGRKDISSPHLLSHQHTPLSTVNQSVSLMEMKRASGVQSSIADSEIDFEVDRLVPKIPPVRN